MTANNHGPAERPARVVTRTLQDGVRRTVLPSGLRIITEAIPTTRSAALGIWVGIGSRDESPAMSGASHFLEHLLFKGTHKRTALQISAEIEAVGGETNAFTTKEYTCYYARVLDSDLPLAVDVLVDAVADSILDPADVETERGVILEEIAMHEDEPGDEVHDVFAEAVYGDHPLGRLISGTPESVTPMTRNQINNFYRRRYRAPQVVIAAAGNLEHAAVVRLVRRALAGSPLDTAAAAPSGPRAGDRRVRVQKPHTVVLHRDTEQAHIVLGGVGMSRYDERRFALGVLNNVLGGGMSSRLFQEIREKRGLAYSVYSYAAQYADSGLFGVYAGCAPGRAPEVLDLIRTELERVARTGITAEELGRGKGMVKGSYVLNLEDTSSRMSRLAKSELLHGHLMSVDELLGRVDAVTIADVGEVAADLLTREPSLAVVGPFDEGAFP
ncbi:M16 family metallopeptidase [Actinoplanes teichomyceticus]|uniref:Putative Zn-dependent peptidase n=1 Tax=Actinoplanes teichomyceticus TaxID=1867 RepID=A0A561WN64_ACTTI|nr:pitrilysin family protein [Actinoplanes teichomyceticus]TWG25316.1 putative Zn-dependent peptidase [Actinoplanes teichomyceticus]GIF10384.1 putative zinc protease [Actinoplanes teichomyceticus]